jgi:hypothetical protein
LTAPNTGRYCTLLGAATRSTRAIRGSKDRIRFSPVIFGAINFRWAPFVGALSAMCDFTVHPPDNEQATLFDIIQLHHIRLG